VSESRVPPVFPSRRKETPESRFVRTQPPRTTRHAGSTRPPAGARAQASCSAQDKDRSRRWTRWNADVGRWVHGAQCALPLCPPPPACFIRKTQMVPPQQCLGSRFEDRTFYCFNALKTNHGKTYDRFSGTCLFNRFSSSRELQC
jgi:hypothetical protein